jgi:hypothetical protein
LPTLPSTSAFVWFGCSGCRIGPSVKDAPVPLAFQKAEAVPFGK